MTQPDPVAPRIMIDWDDGVIERTPQRRRRRECQGRPGDATGAAANCIDGLRQARPGANMITATPTRQIPAPMRS